VKKFFRKIHYRWTVEKIFGFLLVLIGTLIILKVVPSSIWFFIFGLIFICAGLYFIKNG